MRSLTFALTLALGFLAAPAWAEPPSEERLTFLMKWTASALGVSAHNVELPRLVYASTHALMVSYYGAGPVEKAEADNMAQLAEISAYYDPESTSMALSSETDFTDPENEFILVHELTHHLQNVRDLYKHAGCLQELEPDAYRIQNLWVLASGHGVVKDPLSIMLFSMCPDK